MLRHVRTCTCDVNAYIYISAFDVSMQLDVCIDQCP